MRCTRLLQAVLALENIAIDQKREGNSGIKKVVVIEETHKAWQNSPDGPFQARLVTTPPPNALVELEITPFAFTPLAYAVSVAEADEDAP